MAVQSLRDGYWNQDDPDGTLRVVLARRLLSLFFGLWLYGFSMALMITAGVGLDPWDVFHEGITMRTPLSFGTVTILTGVVVLALWIPIRQRPGFGTVANVVVIGLSVDVSLAILPVFDAIAVRAPVMLAGVALNALATGLYIGAGMGTGPRDGLMTGLVRRTGWSVRLVRTAIEMTVLASGWLLGGTVGVGTVVYALAIGPLIQLFMRFAVFYPTPRKASSVGPSTDTVESDTTVEGAPSDAVESNSARNVP